MKKILITGATDGIGYETAKKLVQKGHHVLIHGRNNEKLKKTINDLKEFNSECVIEGYLADFSEMKQVKAMAEEILKKHDSLDVLINNAGVFVSNNIETKDGLELRFAVNTIAPYLLTKQLLNIMTEDARVVNLSSAAQAQVDINALKRYKKMTDSEAYAQSKLAITMWSAALANKLKQEKSKIQVIAVNPKSYLGSKMVKEAYGKKGYDLGIGADILLRASLSDEFIYASGKYYDNDIEAFTSPHPDAMNQEKNKALINTLENILIKLNDPR